MLAKTGLVVISNPTQLSRILRSAQKQVKNMLYVQLMSKQLQPFASPQHPWPSFSQAIKSIYSQAASDCGNLDVRVLLSSLKDNLAKIKTHAAIDLVIFDCEYNKNDIDQFLKQWVENINKDFNVVTLKSELASEYIFSAEDHKVYNHTVLGGTFDHMHLAHKILLSEAALRSQKKMTVGVTEENMLENKILWELIDPVAVRMKAVQSFLSDISPELELNIVPITDPMGPTKSDPSMGLLVVSAETLKGGDMVNEIRRQNGLPSVDILSVELIDEPSPRPNEETKISSSTGRLRLLGSLLKPVNSKLPRKPYIIGLTGGIASGKSGVAKYLGELGAQVINCDLVAHQVYLPGTECHRQVVTEFGQSIISENGEIDRTKLGPIVFGSKEKLDKLNAIVWPAIAQNVAEQIRVSTADVIVIEAAVLLAAQWQHMCHEVWATICRRDEAIKRIQERNKLTEQQAEQRINAQPSSKYYAGQAHVVFCSMWDVQYTQGQVAKAWELLQQRIRDAAAISHESKY
ncbi:bifunctional coenzyme A synthase [Atheta coriaria]|uniref:bifunctional coenzyme A synthase n=1 Tax=Dalotia coriaria TaxID=877792 RepID=UPI0031F3F68F